MGTHGPSTPTEPGSAKLRVPLGIAASAGLAGVSRHRPWRGHRGDPGREPAGHGAGPDGARPEFLRGDPHRDPDPPARASASLVPPGDHDADHDGRRHARRNGDGPGAPQPGPDRHRVLTGIVGLALLIRGRIPGGDRAALLDAAILATGIGALIWAIGFGPFVSSAGQELRSRSPPSSTRRSSLSRRSPGCGSCPARIDPRRASSSCSSLHRTQSSSSTSSGASSAGGDFASPYLLAAFTVLAFVGAAALHPSMAISPERQHVDRGPISRRRIFALTAALLVNPATLAIEVAGRPRDRSGAIPHRRRRDRPARDRPPRRRAAAARREPARARIRSWSCSAARRSTTH